jgi:hypothetical protein
MSILPRRFLRRADALYRTRRANLYKKANSVLGWAEGFGCNDLQLAHDPHDEMMLYAALRMGVLVWLGNLVYWTAQYDNGNVLAETEKQLERTDRKFARSCSQPLVLHRERYADH